MRQIKLRTFFTFLYFILLIVITGYFFYAYSQYKRQHAQLTSQRALAVMHAFQNTIIPIADADHLELIDPVIRTSTQHRPFIESLSLSLDNTTILFSSDPHLHGRTLPPSSLMVDRSFAGDILAGKRAFHLPVRYFTDGRMQQGTLLMILAAQTAYDPFVAAVYTNFIASSLIMALIFAGVFLLIRRHLVAPLRSLGRLILTKTDEKPAFLISDFSTLYDSLAQSYGEMAENERNLESALYLKDYLYEILHTMDVINRLLISDKSINAIMTESCQILAQHGQYHLAWIGDIRDNRIRIVAHSDDPTGYVAQLNLSLDPADPTSQGPSAQSVLQNKTIITTSINLDYYTIWREKAKTAGHGSSICLPLRASSEETPFATLAIYSSKPFGFLAEEITMLEDLAGDIGYAIASRQKKEELQQVLTTDQLTGLPNRALLLEKLKQTGHPKLLLININRFRDINTVYGFDTGDFILKTCARCLADFTAHHGRGELFKLHSDTYALLLPDSCDRATAEAMILSISEHLNDNPFTYNGIDIWITIAASYCDSHSSTIENGEIALKQAKELKTPFKAYGPAMRSNKEHEENITWYKIIKDAIKEGRIVPYFQGIADNQSGTINKYEALVRLILPDGNIVSPFKFLDIAKKTGLYPELTKAMVARTIETFAAIEATVSINLSTEDINNGDIVAFLRTNITRAEIGRKLVFEILESEGISNYEQVSAFIDEFKRLGCHFAIDDFGSGFSNFEHLIRLQVDFLKIDGSLIKNLPHDKNAQVIVRNIQHFAAEMGITTIAEFVSSKEIYELVSAMGIDYSQGYYFSEPRPWSAQT